MFEAPIRRRLTAAVLPVLGLWSCSPSSAPDQAIGGLSVTDSVAVVAAAGEPLNVDSQAITDFPPDADFFQDPVFDHVFDESQKVLEALNDILCAIDQTAFAELVNQGSYNALLDLSECSELGDDTMNPLQLWTVNSIRSGPFAPQRVQIWAPEQGGDPGNPGAERTMFVDITVTQGVSEQNPFGLFTLNFASAETLEQLASPPTCGIFECFDAGDGMVGFSFYDVYGDISQVPEPDSESSITQLEVRIAPDFSVGAANVTRRWRHSFSDAGPQMDSGIQQQEFKVAFDETHLLRQTDDAEPQCLSKTDFSVCHLRYNLYHLEGPLAGQRLERQSGFPIVTEDGRRGFASYDGTWLDDGSPLVPGQVVRREDGGPLNGEEYTVLRSAGRLLEQRQTSVPLVNFIGERFHWFDDGGSEREIGYLTELVLQTGGSFSDPAFFEVAFFDPQTGLWEPIEPPRELFPQTGMTLFLHLVDRFQDALYTFGESDLELIQHRLASRDPILFADGPALELLGYFDVIRHGITSFEAESGDVYYPPFQWTRNEFRENDLNLFVADPSFGSGLAGLRPGDSYQGGPFPDGFLSGPLVTRDVFDGIETPDELFQQEVFFTWETGQQFSELVSLQRGDGSVVRFDPPLFFPYVHSTENDANGDPSFDGVPQPLSYHGTGALHGIPFLERDLDGDRIPDGFFPAFNIADGVVLSNEAGDFVVKAIDRERILEPAGTEPSDLSLDVAEGLSVPDGTGYRTPAIGPRPNLVGPPSVVDGEVIE